MVDSYNPSFKEWLAHFKDTDTNLGDLATDILSDKDFPDSSDKEVLIRYLQSKRAISRARKALEAAVDLYHAAD